jgi:hypothetical protein
LETAVGHPSRVIQPAEQQSGAAQPGIVQTNLLDNSTRCPTREKLITLPQTAQCFARLADLSKDPGRRSNGVGKRDEDVPLAVLRHSALDERASLYPVTFAEEAQAGGEVDHAEGQGMMCRPGAPKGLMSVGRVAVPGRAPSKNGSSQHREYMSLQFPRCPYVVATRRGCKVRTECLRTAWGHKRAAFGPRYPTPGQRKVTNSRCKEPKTIGQSVH